jgi:chromosome segregation ATPase
VEEDSVSKRKSSSRKRRRPLVGTGLQEIVEGSQLLISGAQGRASDAAKQVQRVAADAVSTLEKRRDVELRNLRGRLKDVNTAIGGLERRYRALEKRVTSQIETISGRAVKASDLDKRIRTVESELLRVAGLGRSAAGRARTTAARTTAKKPTTTARRRTTAASTTAKRRTAAASTARKTARTATKRATGAARSASRTVSAAAKAASTTAKTVTKAASTGAAKGTTAARRSAAGSAGGRAKAKRSTARKPAVKKAKAPSPPSSGGSSSS